MIEVDRRAAFGRPFNFALADRKNWNLDFSGYCTRGNGPLTGGYSPYVNLTPARSCPGVFFRSLMALAHFATKSSHRTYVSNGGRRYGDGGANRSLPGTSG
jgi:hypothetical protein